MNARSVWDIAAEIAAIGRALVGLADRNKTAIHEREVMLIDIPVTAEPVGAGITRREGQLMPPEGEIEFSLIDLGSGWEAGSYAAFLAAAGTDYATQPVYFEDLRPAGVEPQIPRITDMAGAVREFGLEIDTLLGWAACLPGKACWKLVGIRFRTGIAATIPMVIGPNGLPNPNILVYENWPGADSQSIAATPPYYSNYVAGFTNGDGVLGFGYGGGGVVGANGGPFNVWPSNAPPGLEPQFADCLKRIGWRGDTDHFTPSGVWAYVVKPSVTPPGGSGCGGIVAAVLEALVKALKGA